MRPGLRHEHGRQLLGDTLVAIELEASRVDQGLFGCFHKAQCTNVPEPAHIAYYSRYVTWRRPCRLRPSLEQSFQAQA
eukprot:4764751-Prymnesium_polylepis.1